jgi:hypothetical protein
MQGAYIDKCGDDIGIQAHREGPELAHLHLADGTGSPTAVILIAAHGPPSSKLRGSLP